MFITARIIASLVVNIDDAWRLTGLTSRNWTDSSIYLYERQIKECRGGWQSLLEGVNLRLQVRVAGHLPSLKQPKNFINDNMRPKKLCLSLRLAFLLKVWIVSVIVKQ